MNKRYISVYNARLFYVCIGRNDIKSNHVSTLNMISDKFHSTFDSRKYILLTWSDNTKKKVINKSLDDFIPGRYGVWVYTNG